LGSSRVAAQLAASQEGLSSMSKYKVFHVTFLRLLLLSHVQIFTLVLFVMFCNSRKKCACEHQWFAFLVRQLSVNESDDSAWSDKSKDIPYSGPYPIIGAIIKEKAMIDVVKDDK
jgi:hypothetical protein